MCPLGRPVCGSFPSGKMTVTWTRHRDSYVVVCCFDNVHGIRRSKKGNRQCKNNVTLGRVCETIVAVGKA